MATADQYFHHLAEWGVVICKECRHAVWPNEVQKHLQGKQHRISRKEASPIAEEVQEWSGVVQYPIMFESPTYVDKPIPELPLYSEGFQCQLEPTQCQYICRTERSIKDHWSKQHQWSAGERKGRSGHQRKARVEERFHEGVRQVQCQRFFPSRHGSQFFEVRQAEEATTEQARPHISVRAIERLWQRAVEYAAQREKEKQDIIQQGDVTETTPWIRRTGWDVYLKGCNRSELLESIAEPEEIEREDDETVEQGEERIQRRIETVIWKAVGELAANSQECVRHSGVTIRLEAVRSETDRQRFHPLQPYQEAVSIERRCQPWQQMLMFFIRTQRQHDWQSPRYRFNRQQEKAFTELIDRVEQDVRFDNDNDDGIESNDETESNNSRQDDNNGRESRKELEENDDETKVQPLTQIERACLQFIISLMNQTIHNREYDMALVCSMAVLGVHPTKGFHDPESYPPILSSIVKVARFIIVRHAEDIARPIEDDDRYSPCSSVLDFDDSGYESNGSSPRPQTRQRRRPQSRQRRRPQSRGEPSTSFDWVRQMVRSFVARDTASPMQWLLDLRTYGLKIHYNTTTIGHVNWKDQYTLEYKQIAFTVDQFRGMVHKLVEETRQALFEDVLFMKDTAGLPPIPWNAIHDDPTNRAVGWSFIDDQRSRLPVDGVDWLYKRVKSDEKLYGQFIREGADSGYDRERINDWMRQIARFRGLMLILMHITGGQPARGPEILSVRHRNTAAGSHRNLFIEDGQVVFVTKYHKGVQITGDVKIIHRYLPKEVGELVVWYLWLALPFIERIEALVWQKPAVSDHMWPADANGKQWTTDRMKRVLQDVSERGLGQPMTVVAYREIAIAISRKWVRGGTAFQRDGEDEDIEARIEDIDDNAADEQATHSPHIAGLIYARDVSELIGSSADKRQRFRKVSLEWHRFLAFESAGIKAEVKHGIKRKREESEEVVEEEHVRRRRRIKEMDASAELQRMMRTEVELRSVQGQAFAAIQRGDSQIVAVMPTGAGKSVLFMLPAFVEPRGVTIVVVPLKALRRDMMYRCEQLGIKCASWKPYVQADGVSIVLVTPERATSEEFSTYIRRLKRLESLDRIVIDECHVILNDQLTFRKHMQQLGRLSIAECQTVLLTATLPPSYEEELFRRMYWQREEVQLIRGSTVRKNIEYSVIDGKRSRKEQEEQVEGLVNEVLEDPVQPQGKVIVMCESKPTVRQIVQAGLFPCEEFHADMPDREREQILDDFRAGNTRVIVATGAFGMGIDIPDIRLVVHVDEPRSMSDYGQASGRAGRDGLRSRAVIIRGGLTFDDPHVKQYIQPRREQCRRVDIDRYLDGNTDRQACSDEEEACDWCQGSSSTDRSDEDAVVEADEGDHNRTRVDEGDRKRTQVHPRGENRSQAHERDDRSQAHERDDRSQAHERDDRSQAHERDDRSQAYEREAGYVGSTDIRRCQAPETRRIQYVQDQANERQAVVRQLEKWKGKCIVCFQAGRAYTHIISRCPTAEGRAAEVERSRAAKKGGIVFTKGAVCYRCGVPQEICDRWIAKGVENKSGGMCQFYGVLIGIVYGIKWAYPKVWEGWFRRTSKQGIRVVSEEDQMKCLGLQTQGRAVEGTWLIAAFEDMLESVEEIASRGGGGVGGLYPRAEQ